MIGDNLLKSNRELHSPHSLFGVMSSGISGNLGADDYDSMYESRSALTTIQKQHFVDWFSGSALDSRWVYGYSNAGSTNEMSDIVDGGYRQVHGGGVHYSMYINFAGKHQYSATGSVIIGVCRMNSVAQRGSFFIGLMNGNLAGSSSWQGGGVDVKNHAGLAKQHERNIFASSADGSTHTTTDLAVGGDAYKTYKTELGSANIKFTVDGVLKATKTVNRPSGGLQPTFGGQHEGGQGYGHITYMECYNT